MNGLTLKSSLCAAEMCNRAKHQSMRLQEGARICEKRVLGQPRNGKYLLYPNSWVLVPRPVRATCSGSPFSSAARSESGSA